MKTAVVILAAGLGSRFGGGVKQLEPVGPNGEIIMDYSVNDAIEAGFNKIVFIIRKDIEKDFIENDMSLSEKALSEYTEMCATIGRNVTFTRQEQEYSGTAVRVDSHGELIVRLSDGSECVVNSGEVIVQGIY